MNSSVTEQLDRLRAVRWIEAAHRAPRPLGFRWSPRTHGQFVPVFATGGIGDLTITLGVCERIAERTGLPVRLWTPYPQVARMFLACWDGRARPNVQVMTSAFRGYEYWLRVNCMSFFEFSRKFDGFKSQGLSAMYLGTVSHRSEPWDYLIQFHPHLDGEVARLGMKMGVRRHELPYRMLDLEPSDYRLDSVEVSFLYTRSDIPGPYVTVHDGYDATMGKIGRATKTWNLGHWAKLVRSLQSQGLTVVQLGGPTSRRIPGVDLDLVGKTKIEESLGILSGSSCHVDGDSGLVHAAYRLGVPAVALFGPTPKDFFGYAENTNLSSEPCNGCFWLTETWLQSCALGHSVPMCMDGIQPGRVLEAVQGKLRNL